MLNFSSHFFGISPYQELGAGVAPNLNYSYLHKITDSIGDSVGIGGHNREFLGKIVTVADQQIYYLPDTLLDQDGNNVDFDKGVKIMEVMYNDVVNTARYIDTWSYYNIMAGEFGVQSALYNTMFAMLPVNANVMMMQHTKYNNKLRLSNYS